MTKITGRVFFIHSKDGVYIPFFQTETPILFNPERPYFEIRSNPVHREMHPTEHFFRIYHDDDKPEQNSHKIKLGMLVEIEFEKTLERPEMKMVEGNLISFKEI